MATVILDGSVCEDETTPETFGELLESIEGRLLPQGRIVSAVRFDGVDQPSFRAAELLSQSVQAAQVIELDSAEPRDVLNSVIDQAVSASDELARAIGLIAARFRTRDVIAANNGLADFARGVGSVVAVVQAIAQTTGVDLDAMTCGERRVAATIEGMNEQIEALAAFQRACDWEVVADILESDVPATLSELLAVLHNLRPTVH